jgi:hypothetical protein
MENGHANKKRLGCFVYATGGRIGGVDFIRVRFDDAPGLDWRGEQACVIPRANAEQAKFLKEWKDRHEGKGKLDKIV